MRLVVHAVGRLKAGPERELVDRYHDRLRKAGPAIGLTVMPIAEVPESQAGSATERRREESVKLLAARDDRGVLALLDERGATVTSTDFADHVARWRDEGRRTAVFAIGGPDGHDVSLREQAEVVWSFGALTWPHQLVRVMLAEQLYRATTILSGHPYHRQ